MRSEVKPEPVPPERDARVSIERCPSASLTAKTMEDEKALQTGALIGDFTQFLQHGVDDLLADGVMTASIVVRCVFLAGNELIGVEQFRVRSATDFI